jgi:hypothetical protein
MGIVSSGVPATPFVRLNLETGETAPMTTGDWRRPIREAHLSADVPAEIHGLFDAARGAMLQWS